MIRDSKELQIGKAGEYLVCADLILKGFVAFPSEQGLPYDVLLDTGKKLLKIQVKTTEKPRSIPQRSKTTLAYMFDVKRAGVLGKTRYSINEIDLFALVCLDTMKIGYLKNAEMPTCLNIRVDSLRGTYYDEVGVANYKRSIELSATHSQKEIAKILSLHISQVSIFLKEGYTPFRTKARYFNDLLKTKDWFYEV